MAKKVGRKKSKFAKLNRQAGSRLRGLNAALELLFSKMEGRADEMQELYAEQGDELFVRMVARTPVVTGKLRRGWEIARRGGGNLDLKVRMENAVFYLRFVEYGTSKQAPQGFVRLSISEFRGQLVTALRKLAKAGG